MTFNGTGVYANFCFPFILITINFTIEKDYLYLLFVIKRSFLKKEYVLTIETFSSYIQKLLL